MIHHTNKGFTLVETLVAVALLALTIVLPYYAIQKSLAASYTSRDDLLAASLAQEGLEFIRAVRDANYLYNFNRQSEEREWMEGLDGSTTGSVNCFGIGKKCIVDPTRSSNQVTLCGGTCPKLYINNSSGVYTNVAGGGTATKYTRYVNLEWISAREVKVTSTVEWFSHGQHSITVTDILNDWL